MSPDNKNDDKHMAKMLHEHGRKGLVQSGAKNSSADLGPSGGGANSEKQKEADF